MRKWRDGKRVAQGAVEHDKEGKARIALGRLAAGAYRIRYRTKDVYGTTSAISEQFVAAGEKTPLALPALMKTEKRSVSVGETARVLALSGLADQRMVLDISRGGKLLERKVLESGSDRSVVEIPITENHRGGLAISMWAVRDHQLMRFNDTILVPWDNKKVNVSFVTFRDRLKPGATETFRVKVTGPAKSDQAIAAAELLAYMYDRSLDAFVPHSPSSPLSLFPDLSMQPGFSSSLIEAETFGLESKGFDPIADAKFPTDNRLRSLIGRRASRFANVLAAVGHGCGAFGILSGSFDRSARDGGYERQRRAKKKVSATVPVKTSGRVKSKRVLGVPRVARQERAPQASEKREGLRSDFAETAF